MYYIRQHISKIIEVFDGKVPLAAFLKGYFRSNPKLGSRDRKLLSEKAYCWYRCSKAVISDIPFADKLAVCLYVCDTSVPQINTFLPGGWQGKDGLTAMERMAVAVKNRVEIDISAIADFNIPLSPGILKKGWLYSMLRQPRLFIRTRGNDAATRTELEAAAIVYEQIRPGCIALPNGTPVDKLLSPDAYVVQDASSQLTGNLFHPTAKEQWWDCCSGAGGKSLLLKDMEPKVNLTVSDKRESIIRNLLKRFEQYHHAVPVSHILDAADENSLRNTVGKKQFDNIICDVPCTGSGTWARTPEQLYFFYPPSVHDYAARQKAIAKNAIMHLKNGGRMIYITCSVFLPENEEVVNELLQIPGISLDQQLLVNGIEILADSMFVAVLKKADD